MEIYNGVYCVYIHTNKFNNKIYIGQTAFQDEPNTRWRNGCGYKTNEHFWSAIQKYGWENFEHEIVASNLTQEEANTFEKLLIEKLDSINPNKGYNFDLGGKNTPRSNSTRKKISQTKMGHIVTEETRGKISRNHANMKGENNPMYGKKFSDEHVKKMSEALKGKYMSDKHCRSKPVIQLDVDGNEINGFSCACEAERVTGINQASISRCCNDKQKTAGGYIWRFIN